MGVSYPAVIHNQIPRAPVSQESENHNPREGGTEKRVNFCLSTELHRYPRFQQTRRVRSAVELRKNEG